MVESRLRIGWRDALDIARGRAVRLDGAHLRRSFVPLCRFSGSLVLAGDASRENDVLSGQARAMAASCRLYDIVAPASFIASVSPRVRTPLKSSRASPSLHVAEGSLVRIPGARGRTITPVSASTRTAMPMSPAPAVTAYRAGSARGRYRMRGSGAGSAFGRAASCSVSGCARRREVSRLFSGSGVAESVD